MQQYGIRAKGKKKFVVTTDSKQAPPAGGARPTAAPIRA